MTARDILADLRHRAVGVYLGDDNRVHLCGDALDGLSDTEIQQVTAVQRTLRPILEAERAADWSPWWPPAPEGRCPTCGGTRFALSAALTAWHCAACEPLTAAPVAWADSTIRQEVQDRGIA